MNDRLRNALEAYRNLDRTLKPVPFADAREKALIEFLHGLAEEYGKKIAFTVIDANGEMNFNIEPSRPGAYDAKYGEELAEWISMVPRRCGIYPTDSKVLPENNWCRINHFDVERLLNIVAERMPAPEADEPANSLAP